MNNEADLNRINKRVSSLAAGSSVSVGLDGFLEQLFAILSKAEELFLAPRLKLALTNPRGHYYQVSQYGMEPAWKTYSRWHLPALERATTTPDGLIISGKSTDPTADETNWRLMLLPMNMEGQHHGYLVLFADVTFQPSETQLEFLTGISYAISSFVQRTLTQEILSIREYEIKQAHADAIQSLGLASEYRDNETGFHIMRMTNLALAIAKAYGLPEDQKELLYVAAPMHDVGKIGIADNILHKPGRLTPEEFAIMQTHTNIGSSILAGKDPMMKAAREIANSHHERWDGSGYPDGLAGEQIPLLARICSIADVFDALTSNRPYKNAWSVEEATDLILSESGKHFDPAVVAAFQAAIPEILRVRELYRDDIIDPNQSITLPPLPPREHSWVEWDDSLSVGIGTIDEHHRYLFDLINDLFEVISAKRSAHEIARLVKATKIYAKVHFRTEELMMRHYGYTGIAEQEHQHHAFESKILQFYQDMHVNPLVAQFNVLTYLRDWLIHHIRVEDAKLRTLVTA